MDRRYIIVESVDDQKVLQVFETPVLDRKNSCMIREIHEKIEKSWMKAAKRFPAPKYDLIFARGTDFKSMQDKFPTLGGWPAEPEQISN
jgi:hypothetical protein